VSRVRRRAALVAAAAAAFFGLLASRRGAGEGVLPWESGDPPRRLSAFRLFRGGGASLEPNDGVLPYDVNTPLFSDYAAKHRFVWMPRGAAAHYDSARAFDFPEGTILVKTFAYPREEGGERLVETRLLVRRAEGWVGLPYVWDGAQSDAVLEVAGAAVDVAVARKAGRAERIEYLVPNVNQCKQCHAEDGARLAPLGPKARQLNRDFAYADGRENQLARWERVGYLVGAPAPSAAPRLPRWDDEASAPLEARARAWLEANCAHCHNPEGGARTTGLDLRGAQADPTRAGVFKAPVAAGPGTGGRSYDIVPGDPDGSILLYRIESTAPGSLMPPLGRGLVHEEGAALIREWIARMKPPERARGEARGGS
jgi:uncharacterized repeat protein (TIGR03806 family)